MQLEKQKKSQNVIIFHKLLLYFLDLVINTSSYKIIIKR